MQLMMIVKVLRKRLARSNKRALEVPAREEIEVAIVDQAIRPVVGGRVRYQGTIWKAVSKNNLILDAGDIVRVTGRVGITILVEKHC